MNVSLKPHFEQLIRENVKSGQYQSPSEVIKAALHLLEQQETESQESIDYYRREIQKGIDRGPATEWNLKETLKKAHKRLDKSEHKF